MFARSQNAAELISILDKVFATKPRSEWERLFNEADFLYSPVQTISEVVDDPQVLANNYIIDFEHPQWGPGKALGFPYHFSQTPASLRRAGPEHGQHTEEVLAELGYTWEDIAELKEEGAIR